MQRIVKAKRENGTCPSRAGSISAPGSGQAPIDEIRKAVSRGEAEAYDLYDALMCSDNPDDHVEALDLVRGNMDKQWSKISLFKMYFNGIGTERDVKEALHILYSGSPIDHVCDGVNL